MTEQASAFPPSQLVSSPIPNAQAVKNLFIMDFTTAFGAVVSLLGSVKTFNIPGLETTDFVSVKCTGGLTVGACIANARVSAPDTLEITFTTAVVLGITLGALNYRLFVLRP